MPALLPETLYGSASPRIAPPLPLRHDLAGYREEAAGLGIEPMPWQDVAATYATALDADDLWLYREFAALVGRQNGKTTFAKPLIVKRLKAGRHIMHIAQVRELPRIMFEAIADALEATPELFPRRRGKIIWPRRGAGSESIVLTNGGSYRIAAAVTGGARGHSIDDLIIDELREMDSFEVINSAKPAQRFSENPQTIYLSNAGTIKSVVLNSLRTRSGLDPALAYLEWSADPDYDAGDVRGWLQANPAAGHYPQVMRDLEKDYVAAKLSGNLSGFETEALCRWVNSMAPPLINADVWASLRGEVAPARRTVMGVSMDPSGERASAAFAWQQDDGRIATRLVADVTGDPIPAAFGEELQQLARASKVTRVGYDSATDAELAKHFKKPEAITGSKFTNASSRFVTLAEGGQIVWDGESIAADLHWTGRKDHESPGTWTAIKLSEEHPVTAALATIRAVWLASGPKPVRPRVY